MAIDILMPALSPSMTHAKLVRWLIDVGDNVSQGDIVAEVESDKAAMEIHALDDGVVQALHVLPSEDDVAVNTPLGTLLEVSDDRSPPIISKKTKQHNSTPDSTREHSHGSLQSDDHIPVARSEQGNRLADRVFISPVAKKIASEGRYNIQGITGSGPRGRIVRRDIERHEPQQLRELQRSQSSQPSVLIGTHDYYRLRADVDVARLEEVINELNDSGELAITLEFHGFLLRAVALAVERTVGFPHFALNNADSEVTDNGPCAIHALHTAGELVRYCLVEDAARKTVAELCRLIADASGSDVSTSNSDIAAVKVLDFSKYGIEFFEGVVDPKFAALLSVGAPVDQPAVVEGSLALRRMMSFSLACEQRSLSELVAARFLRHIKQLLESPWALIL